MRGHTTYACRPAATSSRTRCQTRSRYRGRSAAGTTWVAIGERPAGSSASVETSRSPNTVIATVRGIGVAVITSTCGREPAALSRSASRCSTPNLCCSSMTTSPRSANCTRSSSRACVPMRMPASPVNASDSAERRARTPVEPVSSATRVACSAPPSCPAEASGPSSAVIDR